ncbi:hypothetical protein AA23498_0098 [Acetobacter nitrogenifigens DSM 23921 = NBRC 105050]|nr:hypothetical protein AA23498_0098 [Acetobacter nitrogenifigens DSM 23921 = NBRC 105050]
MSDTTENEIVPSEDFTIAPTGTTADELCGARQMNVSVVVAAVAPNLLMPNWAIHESTSSP